MFLGEEGYVTHAYDTQSSSGWRLVAVLQDELIERFLLAACCWVNQPDGDSLYIIVKHQLRHGHTEVLIFCFCFSEIIKHSFYRFHVRTLTVNFMWVILFLCYSRTFWNSNLESILKNVRHYRSNVLVSMNPFLDVLCQVKSGIFLAHIYANFNRKAKILWSKTRMTMFA